MIIETKNLVKIYGDRSVVNDVSFEVNKGEIYGVIGLSGAGKSTLVRCINLLEKPDSGKVYIDGEDLLSLDEKQLREKRRRIDRSRQCFHSETRSHFLLFRFR